MEDQSPRLAGIELGGTKAIAVLARGRTIVARESFPTTADPAATLAAVVAVIVGWHAQAPLAAIGIASFGPVALDPHASTYGQILDTPKPGWAGFDVLGSVRRAIDVPLAIDTDVNAAALAEGLWGGSAGCRIHAYVTIGTGVGGGIVVDGQPLHGFLHPEIGHVRVPRVAGDAFAGVCPFHGDCIEGLVAGPALAARTGLRGADIADDHPVWANVAQELGDFFANMLVSFAPERIALGGSVVLGRPSLLHAVRAVVARRLAGYLPATGMLPEDRIAFATLGADAGPFGAIALAMRALG
ncbi:ROK family protein [Sphingomonas sp. 28-62-11]|uniref:ROK family protein n=1 Tax=Sphingomonas sp. 28-62-11 TaxID=1970432 RepID=UPI000BCC2BF3|nr:MAG: fructokinase [Sphingomonas sp. 28-62-11]